MGFDMVSTSKPLKSVCPPVKSVNGKSIFELH